MHPKEIQIDAYRYELPEDKIAVYPLPERDGSKLLIFKHGHIEESQYHQLAHFIPENYLLICNNTKVVEARLLFQKDTGAKIEIFCLEPAPACGDIAQALRLSSEVSWHCMIGGASKWKPGQALQLPFQGDGIEGILHAVYEEKMADAFRIRFHWEPASLSFAEVLHYAGNIPLPPYLHRKAEAIDSDRYQTLFAQEEGSVAAPTASLHFTEALQEKLQAKQIGFEYLTLHVGAGTFKPVKSERLADHVMHAEYMEVRLQSLERMLHAWPHLIAVGTTSLRTMESLYWMGVKANALPDASLNDLVIKQWDVYELASSLSGQEALQALAQWMHRQHLTKFICTTQLLMAPPYQARTVQALITNFHQPQSTLLLLVAAFIGENHWKSVYEYALAHNFRFLSYGDGSLLWRSSE
jgi:S-adenosylmethionine:tRNA ribosyltransferase-isomerase